MCFLLLGAQLSCTSGMRSDIQNSINTGADPKDKLIMEASVSGEKQKSGVETENALEKKSGICICIWQRDDSEGEHVMPGTYTEENLRGNHAGRVYQNSLATDSGTHPVTSSARCHTLRVWFLDARPAHA